VSDDPRDTPKTLRLEMSAQRLVIGWLDGHESVFPGAYLRFVCPCAGCRGHAPGEVEPPAWESVKDVRVAGAAPVGGYGLQFTFSDGHGSGIYAFDRLRSACPCAVCAPRSTGSVDLGAST
jgi:DUF971 family protein